jgi:hypothetical protein
LKNNHNIRDLVLDSNVVQYLQELHCPWQYQNNHDTDDDDDDDNHNTMNNND